MISASHFLPRKALCALQTACRIVHNSEHLHLVAISAFAFVAYSAMASSSQAVTIQVEALSTVYTHLADNEKKLLKRKLGSKIILSEILQEDVFKLHDKLKFQRRKARKCWDESTDHIMEACKVLEKGRETGLNLSGEEVQTLHDNLINAFTALTGIREDNLRRADPTVDIDEPTTPYTPTSSLTDTDITIEDEDDNVDEQ